MSLLLRPDQQRVAAYRSGYMAMPAVPGAGKTTVLACLAADLIAEGRQRPGRILIVTYTNSAVGNFRARIGDLLEQRGLPRQQGYEVRTIHSLAMNIVREQPEALGWSDSFTIMDEERLGALMEQLTRAWIKEHRTVWESCLRVDLPGFQRNDALAKWAEHTQSMFRSLIQAFKSRRISPQGAVELAQGLGEGSVLRWAAQVYGTYQRELNLQGTVDFGDLMLGARDLLDRDPRLLERLRQRWTHVFEDEAQDSYRLQEEVLRALAGPAGNLVRVGDANQAIMGTFTAAEPDLFRRFCREESVACRPLSVAGRSSPDILDVANELVRWTREHHPEPGCREALEAQFIDPVPPEFHPSNPRPPAYTVVVRAYESPGEEMEQIARLAARSVGRNPHATIAVLLPTNAQVTAMVETLRGLGVSAQQLGGPTSPDRQRTVMDLLTVLSFVAAPHEPARLAQAAMRLAGLPEGAPGPAWLNGRNSEELFYPGGRGTSGGGSGPFPGPPCEDQALERLGSWLERSLLPADELLLDVAADLRLRGEELAVAHHLAGRVRRFLQEDPLAGLPEAALYVETDLRAMGKYANLLLDRKGFKPLPGVVCVATCHSAKGLEWDTVFVASLTRGEYPSLLMDKVRSEQWFLPDDLTNPEALAMAELAALTGDAATGDPVQMAKLEIIGERLRLLYVAITRARENLLLSYHNRDRFGRRALPALACLHLTGAIHRRTQEGRSNEGR